VTAASARAAIDRALIRTFDVHLIDLRLPDMSGVDLIRELKLIGVVARMVIVTVFQATDTSFDAAAAGADGYVDGPLFGEEVIEVVDQALNGPLPVRHPDKRPSPDHTTELRPVSEPVINPRVREVMRQIDSDLARTWSVAELAARVGLSESRLRTCEPLCRHCG